jgi:integrase
MSAIGTFLQWAAREQHATHNPAQHLTFRGGPLASYRRTYGKQQAAFPGRWLTHAEAYGPLVAATRDGTDVGLRDEIVLRLGLLGMRASEIAALTVNNVANLPAVTWTGKGRKPRHATAGPRLAAALTDYLARYAHQLGRPVTNADPIICPQSRAARHTHPTLDYGQPIVANNGIYMIVTRRAKIAQLGHVAPHDLRRTAAGILHRSTDTNGKHDFDLLDIQKVLGHSDPATTMRSYLDPLDTEVIDRAANYLD